MTHIDESAELYALGMLSESESQQVLAHARECPACRDLLQRAQHVVGALSEAVPQYEPSDALRERLLRRPKRNRLQRGWYWFGAGLAAGLVAAALALSPGRLTITNPPSSDELALTTIVQSHFNHVSFRPQASGAPQAKALYGKHLEWVYVIVHAPPRGVQVHLDQSGSSQNAGSLVIGAQIGTLFISRPRKFTDLTLVLDGKVLARAHPVVSTR